MSRHANSVICYLMVAFVVATTASAGAASRRVRLHDLSVAELDVRARSDAALLRTYSRGIDRLLAQIEASNELFDRSKEAALSPDEKQLALGLFERVLAYAVALDSMARFHIDFWRIDVTRDAARHARHFALSHAAECLEMRVAWAFVDRTLNKMQFETLLDEGAPELGLPSGAYAQLKWHVVHVETVSRVLWMHKYHQILTKAYAELGEDLGRPTVLSILETSYQAIKVRLLKSGARLFAGNALDIIRDAGHQAWFPVQAQVAELLGDAKVHRLDTMLISSEQVETASSRSQPGDVIVERRNWYLSNIALPGFWPHTALWIGSPDELAAFFDNDPTVRRAYGGAFTAALRTRFPDAWQHYAGQDKGGHLHRIIEAMSEGVVLTSAEYSIRCDYAAALRPRLSKLEIARAIERAFSYIGRPYDFDFDFFSDAALVCSELVYKAYEPRSGVRGLRLPLERIVGRMTLGPNTMVRQFDREYGTDGQQLDFVWFLDGREKEGDAVWSDLATFRATHRRFKWDIAQK